MSLDSASSRVCLLGENGDGQDHAREGACSAQLAPTARESRVPRPRRARSRSSTSTTPTSSSYDKTPLAFMLEKFPGDGERGARARAARRTSRRCGVAAAQQGSSLAGALSGGQTSAASRSRRRRTREAAPAGARRAHQQPGPGGGGGARGRRGRRSRAASFSSRHDQYFVRSESRARCSSSGTARVSQSRRASTGVPRRDGEDARGGEQVTWRARGPVDFAHQGVGNARTTRR